MLYYPASILSSLSSADAQGSCGYEEVFDVSLSAGQRLTVTARSRLFSPRVAVESPDCSTRQEGVALTSSASRLDIQASSSGLYRLSIWANDCSSSGRYALTLSSAGASTAP
jgi:hypothetical protein